MCDQVANTGECTDDQLIDREWKKKITRETRRFVLTHTQFTGRSRFYINYASYDSSEERAHAAHRRNENKKTHTHTQNVRVIVEFWK